MRMKGGAPPPLRPPVSPFCLAFFFFFICLLLIDARHERLAVCVCGLNLYERLPGRAGGGGWGGRRRGAPESLICAGALGDKQPTPSGDTAACLIHFDGAQAERWHSGGDGGNDGGDGIRNKMTVRISFLPDGHKMDPCKH